MAAYEAARIVLKGWWGNVRRALPVGATSRAALIRAQKRGDLKSVAVWGNLAADAESGGGDKSVPPVGLAYRLVFPGYAYFDTPAGMNSAAAWEVFGSAAALGDYPAMFGGTGSTGSTLTGIVNMGAGVGYSVGASYSQVWFRSKAVADGGFPMLQNAPFAVRVLIPKPTQKGGPTGIATFTLARWSSAPNAWQLQLKGGALYIMRLAPVWTQTAENLLHVYEMLEDPDSTEQAFIETETARIYKDYTRLDLGSGDDWWGRPRMVALFPEPGNGTIRITDGAKWVKARHSDLARSRKHGTVWNSSRLTVGVSGAGAMFWQVGYPEFVLSGELRLPPYKTPAWMDAFTSVNYTAIHSTEKTHLTSDPGSPLVAANASTLDGTALRYANTVGTFTSQFYAHLTTTNNRYTPLVYAVIARTDAGECDGSRVTTWDSADPQWADDHGNSPILDVQPQHEGEGQGCNRIALVRDVGGGTFELLGGNYDSGAWHVCDYYEGNEKLVLNGIVRRAEFGDMRNTRYNQVRRDVASGTSVVTLEICTQEAALKKLVITEEVPGDFKRIGGHVRDIINLAGTPADEYSGVAASAGKLCPFAVAGENFHTLPPAGTYAMDYLHGLIQEQGNGRHLYHGNGWVMAARPTTTSTIQGHLAEFTSDADANDPTSYPGRFAILCRIPLSFDWEDYANTFIAVGGEDADGNRLCQIGRISSAIVSPTVIPPRIHVGMPVIAYRQNDAWTTVVDCALARRSLHLTYGLPPRFGAFETYYHRGLMPGQRITVDETPARVFRVADGSWAEDRMVVIYRELEA